MHGNAEWCAWLSPAWHSACLGSVHCFELQLGACEHCALMRTLLVTMATVPVQTVPLTVRACTHIGMMPVMLCHFKLVSACTSFTSYCTSPDLLRPTLPLPVSSCTTSQDNQLCITQSKGGPDGHQSLAGVQEHDQQVLTCTATALFVCSMPTCMPYLRHASAVLSSGGVVSLVVIQHAAAREHISTFSA